MNQPTRKTVLGTAAAGSAAAHVFAAATGPGVIAWGMAVMGVLCLASLAPMAMGRSCAGRAAGHLLAMSAAMVLVHVVLLLGPGAASHHGGFSDGATTGHGEAMLSLIGVELLCLIAASAVLRRARTA